jgi:hypothetical protein
MALEKLKQQQVLEFSQQKQPLAAFNLSKMRKPQ